MPTRGALGFKGLKTAGNPLTHPAASLGLAQNCVIPSKDVLEPRRGQPVHNFAFGTTSSTALALYEWGVLPVLHYGTTLAGTTLATFSGSAWVDNGTLVAPDPNVRRAKFAQMSSNLYATSASGLVVLDSTSHSTILAGVARPLDIQPSYAVLSGLPSDTGTWFTIDQAVAYRACFVKKDANNNVKLSAPSGRVVVVNPANVSVPIGSLARTGGSTVTATVTAHNFRAGDYLQLSPGEANFSNAFNYQVTSVTSTTIVWSSAGSNVVSTALETLTSGSKMVSVKVPTTNPASLIGIAAGDFVQLYRTEASGGAAIDPGDEELLCYERQLTATDISNKYVSITDTTPDSFLGAALYTNANTGEGILQSNEKPPICKDVAVFDGRLWGGDTTDRQRLTIRMLGVGSPNGLQNNDIVAVGLAALKVTVVESYLPSRNITETAEQIAFDYGYTTSSFTGEARTARVITDGDSPTGQILFEDVNPGGSAFYAGTSRASAFQDALPLVVAVASSGLARVSNVVTATTSTAHGLTAGDTCVVAIEAEGNPDFPAGIKTVASVSSSTVFTYAETGADANVAPYINYHVYPTKFASSNGARQLRYSKQGQPEAWPLVNWIGGLPDGATVLRIAPLGGSLYVFLKNSDIYTVSGSYPYNVQKFDGTATLIAADSLVEHSGRLHCLTTQGVVAISDTGVESLSYDIETDLRTRIAGLTAAQLARTFAVSYESDRQYQLWMPDFSPPTTLTCTGAWIYHSDSGLWTQWGNTTSTATRCNRTCGLVTKADNLLKLGDGDTGSTGKPQNKLRQEAKTYGGVDAIECTYSFTATGDDTTGTLTPSSAADILYLQAGDLLAYSGNYALVTANNTSTLSYTGTLGNPNAASVTVYMQVPVAFEWLIDAAGAAGVEKHWRDLQAHFAFLVAPTMTALTLTERSVNATASVTITPPDYPGTSSLLVLLLTNNLMLTMRTIRAAVPQSMQRAAMMRLRLTMSGINRFRALGWSQTQEAVSEKTGS